MARTNASARALFKRTYRNGPNLMTPDIIAYGWAGPLAWELSQGDGIRRRDGTASRLHGVTVLEDCGGPEAAKRGDLCQAFETETEARDYIAALGA